jgi:hypothetical protein
LVDQRFGLGEQGVVFVFGVLGSQQHSQRCHCHGPDLVRRRERRQPRPQLRDGLVQHLAVVGPLPQLHVDGWLGEGRFREELFLLGRPALRQYRLQGAGHGLRIGDVDELKQPGGRLALGRCGSAGQGLRSVPVEPGHYLHGRHIHLDGRNGLDVAQHLIAEHIGHVPRAVEPVQARLRRSSAGSAMDASPSSLADHRDPVNPG